MKVFTTINPNGNFEAQHEAMSSWASKFTVYSINTKDEINKIKDIYPYVNFIETSNIYDHNGKLLIKLNAILDVIKQISSKYSCIVNSDIILKANFNINSSFKRKYLSNGIVIGTRYEISEDEVTHPFNNGYDVFMFDIKHIELLYNDNYVIGMPWWDFWIPMITLKSLLSLYHIKSRVIFHRTHDTNYDMESWIHFGEYLYKDLMIDLLKNPIICDVYSFCHGVKKHIESKQINIKIK